MPPCALCTGRLDATQPQEPLEQLSVPERIALVDSGYHSVLSFPDEVINNTHFNAIMKSVEWQQKMLRGSVRMMKIKDKEAIERRNKTKLPEHKTKYTTRIKKTSSSLLTARIKRKMLKGKRERTGKNLHGSLSGRRRVSKVIAQADDDDDVSAQSSSSKHSSPVPSPLQQHVEKVPTKEKISNSHG